MHHSRGPSIRRSCLLFTRTPEERCDALARGLIWYAPLSSQWALCLDIARGVTPEPADMPADKRDMLAEARLAVEREAGPSVG